MVSPFSYLSFSSAYYLQGVASAVRKAAIIGYTDHMILNPQPSRTWIMSAKRGRFAHFSLFARQESQARSALRFDTGPGPAVIVEVDVSRLEIMSEENR